MTIAIKKNNQKPWGSFEIIKEGEHTFIDIEQKHRLENSEKSVLEVIEIQIGDYLEEDDIERIEDDFNRA